MHLFDDLIKIQFTEIKVDKVQMQSNCNQKPNLNSAHINNVW